MARVTGIGGVFLKANDPKSLGAWYAKHLGIQIESWNGAGLQWTDEVPAGTGMTVWALFAKDSDHFAKSAQTAVVNYRVDNLAELLKDLEAAGVPIDPKREDVSYGHFAWITDPEGNRVELWQPLADEA